jgi:hypothetical protein
MSNLQYHKQALKEFLKWRYIDFLRGGSRLRTPMELLISTLSARGYLPSEIRALELFGMCGLWITKDYADICSYLELYEINPVYAMYAHKFIPNATVVNSDSIKALRERRLRKQSYTYIVSDNPIRCPFGNGYCEHFDLFPEIVSYIDGGILQLSFLHNIEGLGLSTNQLQRREEFYGRVDPSVIQAVHTYERLMPKTTILDFVFLPRNSAGSFLAFVLKK